jgi:hypothetical protein
MGIANQRGCQVFKAPSEGMENEPMKNSKLLVGTLALIASGIVGCGGVEGTYKLDKEETKKSMEAEIAKMPADQQQFAKMGMSMADKMDATLELKKDQSMSMSMTMEGKTEGKEKTGTWKKEGDDVVLTSDGKDMKCQKSGKKLTCTDHHASGDSTMVFTKS